MKIWVGLKKEDVYVHEWEGEVAEGHEPKAVADVLKEYVAKGEVLWGVTILLDRMRPGVNA